MKADPSYAEFLQKWSALYEGKNYDEGLAGYFLSRSHRWCEDGFSAQDHFSRVLEVGAGTGVHLGHVKHRFDEYIMTDLNQPMLAGAIARSTDQGSNVLAEMQDATALSYPDESFDRVIAAHVLEHLPKPHHVLREWMRVLRPGGTLSLILPCDPGVAWRLGRTIGARSKFEAAGIAYDYWMAREHINPINGLVAMVRYYFDGVAEEWRPFHIPSMDLNLFYIAHIKKFK